jgi:hypothetical protein
MKTIIAIALLAVGLTGCAYDPALAAARARECSTVTYSKANGRLGMSTVCRRGRDVSVIRNM